MPTGSGTTRPADLQRGAALASGRNLGYRLNIKMTNAFQSVYEMSKREKINMRQAAYLVSVNRVAEACRLRGWV